jgi:hypothetical protein
MGWQSRGIAAVQQCITEALAELQRLKIDTLLAAVMTSSVTWA